MVALAVALFPRALLGATPDPAITATAAPHRVLPGGVELFTLPPSPVPWTSFRVSTRIGSAFDPPGRAGLARVAGLALQLTATRARDTPPRAARQEPRIELHTGLGAAVFAGGAPGAVAGDALNRLLGVLAHPDLGEPAVRHAIARAVAEVEAGLDDGQRAERELHAQLFAGHAYGRAPAGDPRELADILVKDVTGLLDRQLRTGALVVAVAPGHGDRRDYADLVLEATRGMPAGAASVEAIAEPPPAFRGRHVVVLDSPGGAAVLAGTIGPAPTDPRVPALLAANAAIGGSFSSRLALTLGPERKVADVALSALDLLPAASVLTFRIATSPERIAAALRALLETLAAVERDGLGEAERTFGRSYAAARALLDLRDPERALARSTWARALDLEASACDGQHLGPAFLCQPGELPGAISAADPGAVDAAARAFFAARDLAIIVIASSTPALQAQLATLPGVKDVAVVNARSR